MRNRGQEVGASAPDYAGAYSVPGSASVVSLVAVCTDGLGTARGRGQEHLHRTLEDASLHLEMREEVTTVEYGTEHISEAMLHSHPYSVVPFHPALAAALAVLLSDSH